jgi:hypothetical protein
MKTLSLTIGMVSLLLLSTNIASARIVESEIYDFSSACNTAHSYSPICELTATQDLFQSPESISNAMRQNVVALYKVLSHELVFCRQSESAQCTFFDSSTIVDLYSFTVGFLEEPFAFAGEKLSSYRTYNGFGAEIQDKLAKDRSYQTQFMQSVNTLRSRLEGVCNASHASHTTCQEVVAKAR